MKNGLTEIIFILDCSGSMNGLEEDTIGGFNSMIQKQKSLKNGTALISTVLFSDTSKVIHDRIDVTDVSLMTDEQYSVGGCTALLDAIGNSIHHISNIYKYARKEDIPEHTMFIITTDGMENASHKYSSEIIKKLIEQKKKQDNWEFLFLGANIDAVETAARFGIHKDRAVNYCNDSEGIEKNFASMSDAVCSIRKHSKLSDDWKDDIDQDYRRRKK